MRTERTSPATRPGCRSCDLVDRRGVQPIAAPRRSVPAVELLDRLRQRLDEFPQRHDSPPVSDPEDTASRPGKLVGSMRSRSRSFRALAVALVVRRSSSARARAATPPHRRSRRPPRRRPRRRRPSSLTGGEAVVASAGGDVPHRRSDEAGRARRGQKYVDAAVLAPLDRRRASATATQRCSTPASQRGRDRRRPRRAHRRGHRARHDVADGDRDAGALRRPRRRKRRGAARRHDVQSRRQRHDRHRAAHAPPHERADVRARTERRLVDHRVPRRRRSRRRDRAPRSRPRDGGARRDPPRSSSCVRRRSRRVVVAALGGLTAAWLAGVRVPSRPARRTWRSQKLARGRRAPARPTDTVLHRCWSATTSAPASAAPAATRCTSSA